MTLLISKSRLVRSYIWQIVRLADDASKLADKRQDKHELKVGRVH